MWGTNYLIRRSTVISKLCCWCLRFQIKRVTFQNMDLSTSWSHLYAYTLTHVSMPVQCTSFLHVSFSPISALTELFEPVPIHDITTSLTCLHHRWQWEAACAASNPWTHFKEIHLLILKDQESHQVQICYIMNQVHLSLCFHTYNGVISNAENVIVQNYKRAAGVQEHYCETSAGFDELETKSIPLLADGKRVPASRHAGRRLYYTQHTMITSKERESERGRTAALYSAAQAQLCMWVGIRRGNVVPKEKAGWKRQKGSKCSVDLKKYILSLGGPHSWRSSTAGNTLTRDTYLKQPHIKRPKLSL